MPYLLVRHKIADFDKWKPYFDEHSAIRKQYGFVGGKLMRGLDDPQEVIILFEITDLAKARELTESEDMKKIMQEAGVLGKPDFYFLEKIEWFKDSD